MDNDVNLRYFSNENTVLAYARAAVSVGLWDSERIIFEKFIAKNAAILELGCGAGRVAFGLKNLGYEKIFATDFAPPMIAMAREIASSRERAGTIAFSVADATRLPFPQENFDAAVFAFNGLQMIPEQARRERALREIFRVLKPDGIFVFTGHDRTAPARKQFWENERSRRKNAPANGEFGDQNLETNAGTMFIHSADPAEMRAQLERVGFSVVFSGLRSEICPESASVREFSDETRFWVLRKIRGVPA